MEPGVAIVIPTKNEEGNVEPLFRRLTSLKVPVKVIFVDDASTDATGTIEESLKKRYPRKADVFHRKESCGLGKALLSGYEYALMHTSAKLIAQMDGDGQHDPKYLPAMMAAAGKGAGVVLGSRYVESGSVGDWGLWRRATSWGANLLVRRALRNSNVHDATTGYRIFRRDVLEKIVKSRPRSSGYVFQIDTLAIAARSGAKIVEVPIKFKPRGSGRSKLRFRDKKEFFMFALRNMF
ncbi:MAG: glycosyltransferase [Candidatus Aenigmarchaeota archaeon]|nr:glycosyltransferase [Candidatus Aenigmarchaeota archaeon]